MAKQPKQDPAITAVQKLVTIGMLVFMGYLFISNERENRITLPEDVAVEKEDKAEPKLEPVRVQITDMTNGQISYSDLRSGKIVIGKWALELAKEPEEEAPNLELVEPEKKAEKKAEKAAEKPAEPKKAEEKPKVETLPKK
jgi:hypothetical protein